MHDLSLSLIRGVHFVWTSYVACIYTCQTKDVHRKEDERLNVFLHGQQYSSLTGLLEFFPVVSRLHGATAILLYLPPSFLNNSLTLWLWYTFEGGRRLHDWILSTTDQSTMGGVRVMASSCAVKMLAMVFQNNTKDLGWTPLLWAAVQKTCRGLFQMHPLMDCVKSQHSAHKHIFLWLI